MSNARALPSGIDPSVASMVNAEATAIIAGSSALAGGAIVAVSNYVINRTQAAEQEPQDDRSANDQDREPRR